MFVIILVRYCYRSIGGAESDSEDDEDSVWTSQGRRKSRLHMTHFYHYVGVD